MSFIENNELHQQIIKKINNLPPETVANNTLMSNLSNNFSYISNNFSYNLSSISANFSSSSSSIKSNNNQQQISNNDQTTKPTAINQNGKLPTSYSLALINGKLSSLSSSNSITSNKSTTTNDEQSKEANEILNKDNKISKSPSNNTPISSPTHVSQQSNALVQVNNPKIDEELIDIICKLNLKCDFLNKYGHRHDYTGKQINGYFSMLRIVHSFFEYVLNQIDKKRKMFTDLIQVGDLLLVVINAMEEHAKKYLELRVRYDNKDFNYDLLTDFEDEDEIKDKISENKDSTGQNNSESSEDELDEINNFDNISSNLVRLSSHLANSIESMKSQCVFDDLTNNNESFNLRIEEEDDSCKEKIEDYYRNTELKENEDDKEYGKEIKKEEYESTLQKYYKRFNFNFKLTKSNSCTSPINEDGSPKKITNSSSLNPTGKDQRPDSPNKKSGKKYYKYFSNFKSNFEENFNKLTNSETNFKSNEETTTNTTISSPKNSKLVNSSSSNTLLLGIRKDIPVTDGDFLEDSLDQELLNQETKEEQKIRDAKLDEYILSRFSYSNDDLHLVSVPMLYFYEGFTFALNREKQLALIYGRVTPFWYCKSAQNIVSLVRNLIVILTSPPTKSIASLYNTDLCASIFAHRQVNATLDSLLQGLATLEVKAYNRRYFKYLYREHVIYGKTIKLPVHTIFQIPVEGNDLKRHKSGQKVTKSTEKLNGLCKEERQTNGHLNGKITEPTNDKKIPNSDLKNETSNGNQPIVNGDNNDEKMNLETGFNSRIVRCRLINYVRNQNENELCENSHKCLLFHVHGGGFVLSSPDSHELYLRDWAVKIKGIPILSVDYTLRERFPKAPQDVLDVYMFLVDPKNQEKVQECIGFQPEKIVLAGDSAGANLAFSLICCLNEIRRNYPEDYANIKMPISIICVYGAFDIRAVMSPSKFISGIDPILHHGNIMAMIGTYAGISQKIRKTIWSRIKHRRSIAWYRVSERELKARFKTLSKALESYFASPLIYPYFDNLKDISLHLISSHFCPLIDDSVVLFKAWKGSSSFDVFDGLPHAFLNFSDRSEEAKIATDKVAERIIQAFTRKKIN